MVRSLCGEPCKQLESFFKHTQFHKWLRQVIPEKAQVQLIKEFSLGTMYYKNVRPPIGRVLPPYILAVFYYILNAPDGRDMVLRLLAVRMGDQLAKATAVHEALSAIGHLADDRLHAHPKPADGQAVGQAAKLMRSFTKYGYMRSVLTPFTEEILDNIICDVAKAVAFALFNYVKAFPRTRLKHLDKGVASIIRSFYLFVVSRGCDSQELKRLVDFLPELINTSGVKKRLELLSSFHF